MSITEFLLARIAEDEEQAETCRKLGWFPASKYEMTSVSYARILAECEAKRKLMDLYERHRENRDARRSPRARDAEDEQAAQDRRTQEARTRVAEDAIRTLAAVYSDHPEYRQEWKVSQARL